MCWVPRYWIWLHCGNGIRAYCKKWANHKLDHNNKLTHTNPIKSSCWKKFKLDFDFKKWFLNPLSEADGPFTDTLYKMNASCNHVAKKEKVRKSRAKKPLYVLTRMNKMFYLGQQIKGWGEKKRSLSKTWKDYSRQEYKVVGFMKIATREADFLRVINYNKEHLKN